MLDVERFIDGYIDAALWADCWPKESDPDGECGGREHLELREGAREAFAADCADFIACHAADLAEYVDTIEGRWNPSECAGHDFRLTRGGHGTGFWDRGLGALGDRLSKAARAYGEGVNVWDCGDGTADADYPYGVTI